jgi:hypothetical protein
MFLRKAIVLFLVLLTGNSLITRGQVISTEPLFPTSSDSIRIIFNAAAGNRGLAGFAGPIWAHTGLITDQSSSASDWRYVIAGWSTNLDKAKLSPLGNDLWELKIGPSIRSFYGVPSTVAIKKIALVFRNQDGSKTGRNADGSDIFQDVYLPGLNLVLLQPSSAFLVVGPLTEIPVRAATSGSDSIVLFRDGQSVARTTTRELTYSMITENEGIHHAEVVAYLGAQTVTKSFQYYIKGQNYVKDLPPGVRDGINYPDDHSAILVLFAPRKDHVFAIGDFTNWEIDPDYLMYKTPDSSRYWIRIDSLVPGREYIFQYLVDGDLRIADPYSTKVSDPWNDQYISSQVYPGLIHYPAGKTTQIASVIQPGKVSYAWKIGQFQCPEPNRLVIFELLMRDFTQCHTFGCIPDTIKYLKSLGINAVELMPVSEFEGNDSWGYNPSFYFATDKYYGPENDFKAFIDACHENGIAVIMDMVLNHSYGQSPLVRLYWDGVNNQPAADNPWYNVKSPNAVYSWGYDFNHESIYTQKFVDSVNSYWMNEFHVDGFRFDFTKGFTNTPGDGGAYDASRIRILKRMADRIWSVKPGAAVILEHFTDNREEKELSDYGMMIWGNSNYNYRKATSSYFLEGKSDFSSISWLKRGWTKPNLVGYMESHDEERLMYECYYWGNTLNPAYKIKDTTIALRRMELDANFFIPVPGPKMIWMFGELGYDYSINFNSRVGAKPVRWDYLRDPRRKRLNQVYSVLNRMKAGIDMFSTADFQVSFSDTVKYIHLNHPSMNATILGNYGIRPSRADPDFQHAGWWYELWTGDSLMVTDVNGNINLAPGEYRFYTDVKMARPDIISGIDSPADLLVSGGGILVYPNPATDRLLVDTGMGLTGKVTVRIFDVQGRLVILKPVQQITGAGIIDLDISALETGVYVLEVQTSQGNQVARWIKN